MPPHAWLPLRTADGSTTLLSRDLDQACHSRHGAWSEAWERYAQPARLAERARSEKLERLRLLDVGTGLGWNLSAALEALRGTGVVLDALTLELDRGVIEAALALARSGELAPPELARRHAPVAAALERALADPQVGEAGVPLGEAGRLRLLLGDAARRLAALEPTEHFDAVFLDPFSPRVDPPLWEEGFLAEIAGRMDSGAILTTYSASMEVRARLARAGLEVGLGPRVGGKSEGTLAGRGVNLPELPERARRRLARRVGGGPPPRPRGGGGGGAGRGGGGGPPALPPR